MSIVGCFGFSEIKSDTRARKESSQSSSVEKSSMEKRQENQKLQKAHQITQIKRSINNGQVRILKDQQHVRGLVATQSQILNGNDQKNGNTTRKRDNSTNNLHQIQNSQNPKTNNNNNNDKLSNTVSNFSDNRIKIAQNSLNNQSRFVVSSQAASIKEENNTKNATGTKYNIFPSSIINKVCLESDNQQNNLPSHVSSIMASQKVEPNASTTQTTIPNISQFEQSQKCSNHFIPSDCLSCKQSLPFYCAHNPTKFILHQEPASTPFESYPQTIIYIDNVSINNSRQQSKDSLYSFSQISHLPRCSLSSDQTQPSSIVSNQNFPKINHPNMSQQQHTTNTSFQDQQRALTFRPVPPLTRQMQTESDKCNGKTDSLDFCKDEKHCKNHRVLSYIAETASQTIIGSRQPQEFQHNLQANSKDNQTQKSNWQVNSNNNNVEGQYQQLSSSSGGSQISLPQQKYENYSVQSCNSQPTSANKFAYSRSNSQSTQPLYSLNQQATQVSESYNPRHNLSTLISDSQVALFKKDPLEDNEEFIQCHQNDSVSQNTAQFIDISNQFKTNLNDHNYCGSNENLYNPSPMCCKGAVVPQHQQSLELYTNKRRESQNKAFQLSFLDSSCWSAYGEDSQERKQQDLLLHTINDDNKKKQQKDQHNESQLTSSRQTNKRECIEDVQQQDTQQTSQTKSSHLIQSAQNSALQPVLKMLQSSINANPSSIIANLNYLKSSQQNVDSLGNNL